MARYTGSVCRLCRREGVKLFLKGDRCYGPKCAVGNRPTPPGEHGQARQKKQSEYGMQLREKSADSEHFKAIREGSTRVVPKWLTLDAENLKGTVAALPQREDVDLTLQEHLIVELYSR